MKFTRDVLCSSVGLLLTLASLGCGSGNYTPPAATIAPTAHPLVAQYNILHASSLVTGWVEFGPDTNYGRQTSVVANSGPVGGGQTLSILVAGMKPQTTYHMRAHATWPGGSWVDQDRTFTTGAVPPSIHLPSITVTLPDPNLSRAPGVELLSLTGAGAEGVVSDLQGNVIWYCPGNAEPLKPMANGHFIIVEGTDLLEVDLSCAILRDVSYTQLNQSLQANGYDFTIPPPLGFNGGNPFHHDVLVLPNGHWIALSQITNSYADLPGYPGTTEVVGDAVIDIDPTGNVAWAWSAFDHLDHTRYPYFGLPDWTHSNALVYTADGNLLVSMRNQSWILKLDYQDGTGSGNVLWKLGEDGDFTLPGGNSSDWFYAQHYPNILSVNGSQTTMAVYDDGDLRVGADGVSCGPPIPPSNCYSRATIFQIDESTNLASLQWQYLPGFFSYWGGSIDTLSNSNVEFDSSAPSDYAGSTILEVTQTDTPQVVWQMNIATVGAYRGYRIPSLYPGVTWQQ
jgi:arylsulfate sulfotransferase